VLFLLQLVSLTFTSASTNASEMNRWWLFDGNVGTLVVLTIVLTGTGVLLFCLEYLEIIRFPFPYYQSMFKINFKDRSRDCGLTFSLILVGVHFLLVRT